MRILQLDVASIEYKPIKQESNVFEKAELKSVTIKDALVLFTAVEIGDTKKDANQAINDASVFAKKQKLKKLVVYPFAHLSANLEEPKKALEILKSMREASKEFGMETYSAPFGWNKELKLEIKGHPLAEQSRSYGSSSKIVKVERKRIDTSIVKKSDWSGLPEKDHRTIGEKLDLYSFQEVSPAMVYWHSKGYTVYKQLVEFVREKEEGYGYEEVSTPALANIALWQVSGHSEHYMDDMFTFESDFGYFGMKPMNCPSAILIYKSRRWSYRELPFRTMTFDKLYRSELSGAVTGLFRVKELTQDDSHVFMREDQTEAELTTSIKMVKEIYGALGMKFTAKLSTMPDDHAGDEATWEKATGQLKQVLDANKMKYEIKEQEGSFYAPKIDFDIFDSQGRAWQCATIQLDYQMPRKFEIEYTGEDGKIYTPVLMHRAILGSMERFIGILAEHYQGKFPSWLAPIQVRIISISEDSSDYANNIYEQLKALRVRAELDISDKTMEYKVRDAQMQKIPYMLIIGKREKEGKKISVRARDGKQRNGIELEGFLAELLKEISERK